MSTRRTLAVGLIGYKFMGKAHANGWRQAPHFFDLPANLRLKTICGETRPQLKEPPHNSAGKTPKPIGAG
jgi:hypothetical protein